MKIADIDHRRIFGDLCSGDLVFGDEAHNLQNSSVQRYLFIIIFDKRMADLLIVHILSSH
jgi:hypothetical protein